MGPGLFRHARFPLHAFVPMAPSDPALWHAFSPLQDPALTFPWRLSQALGPWQLFLATFPWFSMQASGPTQLFSPTVPWFSKQEEVPWQACLEILPRLL